MSAFRVWACDAGSGILRMAVSMAVMAVVTPAMVRTLGPTDFGFWSLAFSWAGGLALLEMGLGTTLVRFTAEAAARGDVAGRNRVVTALATLFTGLAVFAGLLAAAIGPEMMRLAGLDVVGAPSRNVALAVIVMRLVVLQLPMGVLRGVLFAHQKIAIANLIQTVCTLGLAASSLFVLYRWPSVEALAWLNLGWMLAEHFAYGWFVRRLIPDLRLTLNGMDRRQWVGLLRYGSRQFVINVASFLQMRFDVILVAALVDLRAVAAYALALKVVEALHLLLKQGVNVLAPRAAAHHGAGRTEDLDELFRRGARWSTWAAALVMVPLAVEGERLLTLWVGPLDPSAGKVLAWLALSSWGSLSAAPASLVLAMGGGERHVAVVATISALVNLGGSCLLGYLLGSPGIALGTLVAVGLVEWPVLMVTALRQRATSIGSALQRIVGPGFAAAAVLGVGGSLAHGIASIESWFGIVALQMSLQFAALLAVIPTLSSDERRGLLLALNTLVRNLRTRGTVRNEVGLVPEVG